MKYKPSITLITSWILSVIGFVIGISIDEPNLFIPSFISILIYASTVEIIDAIYKVNKK